MEGGREREGGVQLRARLSCSLQQLTSHTVRRIIRRQTQRTCMDLWSTLHFQNIDCVKKMCLLTHTHIHTRKSPENTLMVFNPDHFLHGIRADAKVPHLIWEQQSDAETFRERQVCADRQVSVLLQ